MPYVPIPRDLSNVKTKFLFNLTKRQLICFSLAAVVGVPLFFMFRGFLGNSSAVVIMMIAMFPFFMLAMYEKHNQPLEVILKNYISVRFLRPKKRIYMTDNFYSKVDKQMKLEKEVRKIVKKTNERRKEINPTCDKQGKK